MALLPFQTLTIVRLVAAPDPPPFTPDLFSAHISHLMGLVEEGKILANGPVQQVDDPAFRGMSLYTVGVEEARALAEADPAVRAGVFRILVDGWMFPAIPKAIGDRHDLELDVPWEGEGRSAGDSGQLLN